MHHLGDFQNSLVTLAENQTLLARTVDRISILLERQKGETK